MTNSNKRGTAMTQIDEEIKARYFGYPANNATAEEFRADVGLLLGRKRTISETFDYTRVKEWAQSSPRKPANLSFTSGIERNVAYLIEDLDSQPRTIGSVDDELMLNRAIATYQPFLRTSIGETRTITQDEFEKVRREIVRAWEENTVLWSEPAAKATLATLGITVER